MHKEPSHSLFYGCIAFNCMDMSWFIEPAPYGCTMGMFPFFSITNSAEKHNLVHISFFPWTNILVGYSLKSGIAKLKVMCFCNFDRSGLIVLHKVSPMCWSYILFWAPHCVWITLARLSAFYSPARTQEPSNACLLFVKHTSHEVFCSYSE